jgi:hydrogenase maturation protein HypF
MWHALLDDLQQHIFQPIIAAKFHQSLVSLITEMVKPVCQENIIHQVALTGGVFQNSILLDLVTQQLQRLELNVFTHNLVLTNDGGLSLGKAAIAAARLIGQVIS